MTDDALMALAQRVRHDLACINYPHREWVAPRTHNGADHVYDVVIAGGGQCGLTIASGLLREKVTNVLVIDENPEGNEGPWITYARMITLRTPKYITGPDLGVPSLSFRSFWEAQFGAAAWEELDKIPREEWMRYLRWIRATLDLPVRNEVRLDQIEPVERGLFRLQVSGAGAPAREALWARKVVLATGIQGGGEWHVPGFIAQSLPRELYAHTSETVDYDALVGRSIGILGGGASAFDNAQYALGAGVAEAHVFIRKPALSRINPIRFMENSGFLHHFADLDDAAKYRGISFFLNHSQPPTNDTFQRASKFPGFHFHPGAPWEKVATTVDGMVEVTTPAGVFRFAKVIVSTGLLTDARLRPELRLVANAIATWRDRYSPPADEANPLLDDHPYLGTRFEFLPRDQVDEARLYGLFAFNYSALASLGLSASALSGLKYAAPKLIAGVTRQLFLDDNEQILCDLLAYNTPEFEGQWPGA